MTPVQDAKAVPKKTAEATPVQEVDWKKLYLDAQKWNDAQKIGGLNPVLVTPVQTYWTGNSSITTTSAPAGGMTFTASNLVNK